MKKIFLLLVVSLLRYQSAQATVFDAADILPPNSGAISGLGEIILTDPTSEGIEAHGRYGLSEAWNVGAFLGTGTKDKNFRFGGQGLFNLLPDWEGQMGLSFLGKTVYLRRYDTGGILIQVGPLLHKRIVGIGGLPANLHLGVLWQLETRSDHVTSGSQFVFGSDFDIGSGSQYYMSTELGIRLAKADSYILLGFGTRLGDLTFTPKSKEPANSPAGKRGKGAKRDYTDEDFK